MDCTIFPSYLPSNPEGAAAEDACGLEMGLSAALAGRVATLSTMIAVNSDAYSLSKPCPWPRSLLILMGYVRRMLSANFLRSARACRRRSVKILQSRHHFIIKVLPIHTR